MPYASCETVTRPLAHMRDLVLCWFRPQNTNQMFLFTAEDVLRSLAMDSDYYEGTEEWDKLDRVMELFKFIKQNTVNGLVTLTQEQRDIYWMGTNDIYQELATSY